jgi:hypothetical protein
MVLKPQSASLFAIERPDRNMDGRNLVLHWKVDMPSHMALNTHVCRRFVSGQDTAADDERHAVWQPARGHGNSYRLDAFPAIDVACYCMPADVTLLVSVGCR